MVTVDEVLDLYRRAGDAHYEEAVSQTAHGLQAAALAVADGAPDHLVAAALLHDVGHLVIGEHSDAVDLHHEAVGSRWLAERFGRIVADPVALHVRAKRYLCAVEPDYHAGLSEASVRSLLVQRGPLTEAQVAAFESLPSWADAVALRRWDDRAKDPAAAVPGLDTYRPLLAALALLT